MGPNHCTKIETRRNGLMEIAVSFVIGKCDARRWLIEIAGLNFVSCLMIISAIILNIFSESELFILKMF